MKNTKILFIWKIYDLLNPADVNELKSLYRREPGIKKEFKCPFCEKLVWINMQKTSSRYRSMYFKHLYPSEWCYFYHWSNIKNKKYMKISIKHTFKVNKNNLCNNLKKLKDKWLKIFKIFSTLCYELFKDFLNIKYFNDFLDNIDYLINKWYFYKSNINEKELAIEMLFAIIDQNWFIIWKSNNKYTLLYANKWRRQKEKKLCVFKDFVNKPIKCKYIEEILDNIDFDNLTKSDIYWEKYLRKEFESLINKKLEECQ